MHTYICASEAVTVTDRMIEQRYSENLF